VRRPAQRSLGPEQQPPDLAQIPVRGTDAIIIGIPDQVSRRRDPLVLLGDQGPPLAHPRVDDEFTGLPLQLRQGGTHRRAEAGDDSRRVGIDELSQLLTVAAAETANP
jgi:hypothetical protein